MADTSRTKSALATILADNTAGDISPQDLRDLMESLDVPYGELYQTGNSTNTTDGAALLGTFTLGTANQMDKPSASRLRYTGAPTRKFMITAAVVDNTEGSGDISHKLTIAKNGTKDTKTSVVYDHIDAVSKSTTVQGIIELATNDYVEIWYDDNSGFAVSGEFLSCHILAHGLFG